MRLMGGRVTRVLRTVRRRVLKAPHCNTASDYARIVLLYENKRYNGAKMPQIE